MTTTTTIDRASATAVRQTVAAFLSIDPDVIEEGTPLTAYGVDSLGALQLVAELEDRFECSLPESLLADCPDLERLTHVLCDRAATPRSRPDGARERMRSDSTLADDVRPRDVPPAASTSCAFLTGATGFLGASLVRSLVDSGQRVVCLVRPNTVSPPSRVRASLERYGVWREGDDSRIEAVAGDIGLPRLGLANATYHDLARRVDAVYHSAADVNWVAAYEALRSSNVAGTTSVLRFACTAARKRFHFVSSLSVCLADAGPSRVAEDTDMLAWVDRLPLGYAQSKCVGEALVRAAGARGLPARIYRPALLAGHSVHGRSNADDLIAALIKGCVQMGSAPDLDWPFDAVPVDTAAEAIVRLGASDACSLDTFHIRHPRPRHWRECVLWLNVFGYPVRLEPFAAWQARLAREARAPEHALYRLRGFFTRRVGGRTAPEQYQAPAHERIDCGWTRSRERVAGVDYPPLDAGRLDRYLSDLIRQRFIGPPPSSHVVSGFSRTGESSQAVSAFRRTRKVPQSPPFGPAEAGRCGLSPQRPNRERSSRSTDTTTRIEGLLRQHFADDRLRVARATLVASGSDHSITSELSSWKRGCGTGLFHYRLDLERSDGPSSLELLAKIKPSDDEVLEIAETTAAVVDRRVAKQLARFRDRVGVRGSHIRELAIYALHSDPRTRRHVPLCYGSWRDDRGQSWGLLLERLDDMAVLDATADVTAWTDEHLAAAIDGLAVLHAAWFDRGDALRSQPWMGHIATLASVVDMTPLWTAMASHAAPMFARWAGAGIARTHRDLVRTIATWWPALDALPRTLIHNDFNSRNVAIRRTADGPRLVAYDWELATLGAPQRDLAELLCFTLPPNVDGSVLERWIEHGRRQLEQQAGVRVPRAPWQAGFHAALADLLISRLAFYALIHRVRPQPFLPRVVATWSQLFALGGSSLEWGVNCQTPTPNAQSR